MAGVGAHTQEYFNTGKRVTPPAEPSTSKFNEIRDWCNANMQGYQVRELLLLLAVYSIVALRCATLVTTGRMVAAPAHLPSNSGGVSAGCAILALFNGIKPGVVDILAVNPLQAEANITRGLDLFEVPSCPASLNSPICPNDLPTRSQEHFGLIKFVETPTIMKCAGSELKQCMYVWLVELRRVCVPPEPATTPTGPVQVHHIQPVLLRLMVCTGGPIERHGGAAKHAL